MIKNLYIITSGMAIFIFILALLAHYSLLDKKYRSKKNKIKEGLNIQISFIRIFATLLLLMVTIEYVIETQKLRENSEKQIDESVKMRQLVNKQIEESIKLRKLAENRFILESRPYVYVSVFEVKKRNINEDELKINVITKVMILCIGKSDARNVTTKGILKNKNGEELDSNSFTFEQNLYPDQKEIEWPFEMEFSFHRNNTKKSIENELKSSSEKLFIDILIEYNDRSSKVYREFFYYWYSISENKIYYLIKKSD